MIVADVEYKKLIISSQIVYSNEVRLLSTCDQVPFFKQKSTISTSFSL